MTEIKRVALAGASGALGPHVLKALLQANFQVTILTRSKESASESAAKVVEVDYASVESLTSALMGHDAVVSTVGLSAIEGQKIIIDAAIAAGVKHFIPSEFASCSTNPELRDYPLYSTATKIREYLMERSNEGVLSYTILAAGVFLDLVLATPTLLDFDKHAAVLVDGGNNRLSANSMGAIGRGIASVLNNLDQSRNRILFMSQVIITQNGLIKIAEELKPETKWSTSSVKSSDLLQQGLEAFAAGDASFPSIVKILSGTAMAGDRYGSAYDETDNELLGVEFITPAELKTLVAQRLG